MSVNSGSRDEQFDIGTVLIGVGALVTVIGAFLPWLTAEGWVAEASASGIDMISDAVLPIYSPLLTVGVAILAVVLTLGVKNSDLARAGEIAAGVLIALVALLFVVSPETVVGGGLEGAFAEAFTDPGIGIIATLAGGIGIAIGGAVNLAG